MSQNARLKFVILNNFNSAHSAHSIVQSQTRHVVISSAVYSTCGIRSPLKIQHQNNAHLTLWCPHGYRGIRL